MSRPKDPFGFSPATKREPERMSETNIVSASNCHVRDIDTFDSDDPFFMTTYVKDIFKYLKAEEEKTLIPEGFMNDQRCIKTGMRQKLVDWIMEISMMLKLLPETYLLSVYIVDKYISVNKSVQKFAHKASKSVFSHLGKSSSWLQWLQY